MSVVVTRMQDLAYEFSKKFSGGDTPDPHSRRERPPPTYPQPGLWSGSGRKRPGVATQTSVPLNFLAVVVPLWNVVP